MATEAQYALAASFGVLSVVCTNPATAQVPASIVAPVPPGSTGVQNPDAPVPQERAAGPVQPDAAPRDAGTIQDIVVTAQKRAESISKAPLAISAIGQQSFDRLGATSIADVVRTVPNLAVNANGLSIRGLGAVTTLGFGSPTVAFHIDGIYQEDFVPNLYDIERVEILRGPQGTLYGRNSTAGVVNVITARPQDKWTGTADMGVGNFGRMVARGMLNVPITSTLAIRGAVTYDYSDGAQFNPGDNYAATGIVRSGQRGDSFDRLVARVSARWHPSDLLEWNVNATWEDDQSRLRGFVPGYYANFPNVRQPTTVPLTISPRLPPIRLITQPGAQDYSGAILYPSGYPKTWAFAPRGSGAFGTYADRNANDLRTFAVRSNLLVNLSDTISGTYLFGYKNLRDNGRSQAVPFALNDQYFAYEDFSHEVDLNYSSDFAKGVIGLYYFRNEGDRDTFTRVWTPSLSTTATPPFTPPTLNPAVDVGVLGRNVRQTTKAVFGQLTINLTRRFRATGGIRYNQDSIRFSSYTTSLCPFGFGLSPSQPDPTGTCATLAALPNIAYAAVAGTPVTVGQLTGAQPFPAGFNPFTTGRVVPLAARKFDKISWKGTAEYDLTDDILGYATVASGYKAGGVGDQTLSGDARFYQPETDINYEFGVRSKLFGQRLSLALTGFWTDYTDLQVPEVRVVAGRPTTVVANAGKARSRGVEFEFGYALSAADRITGYATYLDARFRRYLNVPDVFRNQTVADVAGNRLAGSPELTVRAAYSHIFELGGLGTVTPTLQGQYQTNSYTGYLNTVEQRVGSFFQGDASVRYESRDGHLYVEGTVTNFTNRHFLIADFPVTGGGIALQRYAQGRAYLGRVGFKF